MHLCAYTIVCVHECVCSKLYRLLFYYTQAVFLCVQGLAMLIIPPTIVHLEILFENTVAILSLALISRSALYLMGCFLGGLLFDRVGWKELQLSVTLLFRAVAIAVSPFFSEYWFIAVWGIFGLLMGYGEIGKKSLIYRMYSSLLFCMGPIPFSHRPMFQQL